MDTGTPLRDEIRVQKDTPGRPSLLRRLGLRLAYQFRSLESRLNRPLLPRGSDRSFLDEWEGGDQLSRLAAARPRWLVTITTYRRPAELEALVEELAWDEGMRAPDLWLCILNDRSDADYRGAREALARGFAGRHLWLDARRQMGKRGFWRTHQVTFLAARAAGADFLLSLQDDLQLAPGFLGRVREVWGATGRDPGRRVLYLFSHPGNPVDGQWITFRRLEVPGVGARRTDWFDLQGFLIDREGLALLRYWVVPVAAWRWLQSTVHSSGVGRQLTKRLFGRATTWQCDPPLIFHGAAPSEMNAEVRRDRPLDNRALFPGTPPAP
jgi:hypothetical protein